MSATAFDFIVIGGGSGGVRAARIAANHGARVAIVEADRFGGTCVIRGCIPKKFMVYASRFADEFASARDYGWSVEAPQFDWATLVANKNRQIARLENIYASNLEKAGVQLFRARARLAGAQQVRLDDGRLLRAPRILIATGGTPYRQAAWAGLARVITSEELFELPKLPPSMVIVGGGYIAVEFACLLQRLGCQTTLVYRGEQILRGFDQELRQGLAEALRAAGITLRLNTVIERFESRQDQLELHLNEGQIVRAHHCLMAIGRVPNTQGLGLADAGVAVGARGQIKVDRAAQTNVPGIYAVGDVTDRINLTPVAIREGHRLADRLFGQQAVYPDYEAVPTAVFTTPELGTVGLTQEQALAQVPAIEVYRSRFRPLKDTLGSSTQRVLFKLITDAQTQRILGAHMLGADAGEMIQLLAVAIKMGATKADLDRTVALHPSMAEEWVTLGHQPEKIIATAPAPAAVPLP
ncbi:glutathione-disulfide reductase [Sinimarinibacterium sp. NLF-5-8]|uniref:glutathione-disulfide reductase n=1 Tax=Sinimarinibacterium sp. NLF-5-8 TaxID=2698684 RepID=UPI00137C1111|nr:glutathione-disulfide reductase [Sinimarinibacterium sp. NLF-5-8]QHS09688.1 glutathione-disulfide reductase [Sinimarinibacterium sp. NLF-5-8]